MANDFSPALNPGINKLPLEMGTVTKIFYQFQLDEEPFWDETIQWIITGTDEKSGCNIWLNYDYQGRPKFDKTFPGSRILACWMSQEAVDAFAESQGYEVVSPGYQIQPGDTTKLLKPLSDAFGVDAGSKLQPGVDPHITTWLADPCTKGSWEVWPENGLDLEDYYNFFEQRDTMNPRRLFLSGSGACIRHFGFMQGGHYAGIKAANWACKCIDNPSDCDEPPYSPCDDPGNLQNPDYQGGPQNGNNGRGNGKKGNKKKGNNKKNLRE